MRLKKENKTMISKVDLSKNLEDLQCRSLDLILLVLMWRIT